jgi:hypothetical protein
MVGDPNQTLYGFRELVLKPLKNIKMILGLIVLFYLRTLDAIIL